MTRAGCEVISIALGWFTEIHDNTQGAALHQEWDGPMDRIVVGNDSGKGRWTGGIAITDAAPTRQHTQKGRGYKAQCTATVASALRTHLLHNEAL